MILVAPAAGGTRSTTQDLLQARFILFSHWPVVRTVIDVTVGDVIKRVSATAAATNAFAPEPVDPIYERRLLSVNMTPECCANAGMEVPGIPSAVTRVSVASSAIAR